MVGMTARILDLLALLSTDTPQRLREVAEQIEFLDNDRNALLVARADLIQELHTDGLLSLREVAALAMLSHTAVAKILAR